MTSPLQGMERRQFDMRGETTMTFESSRTKYVFAGTPERGTEVGTKVCPRCGEILFEDMDVCFGCLYSFAKDVSGIKAAGPPTVAGAVSARLRESLSDTAVDLLDSIELDEIDDDVPEDVVDDDPPVQARHRRCDKPSADDTLDLSSAKNIEPPENEPSPKRVLTIIACSKDMQVKVPLPKRGLTVGRGEGNDIVLFSPSVSRQHLVLLPGQDEVVVEDRGATNPALVDGEPLEGSRRIGVGELVVVCGTKLRVGEEPPDPAA